jgi:hypothetical protein
MTSNFKSQVEALIPHDRDCLYRVYKETTVIEPCTCDRWNTIAAIISAYKSSVERVINQDKHWSFGKDHVCQECRGVNKRLTKIRANVEKEII